MIFLDWHVSAPCCFLKMQKPRPRFGFAEGRSVEGAMNNNGSEVITFTRNELYEKIWNTPTIKLAKDFGLSDVALGKICKKHSISKPPLGYWAKLAHGKPAPRPPLPNVADQRLDRIEIGKRPLPTAQVFFRYSRQGSGSTRQFPWRPLPISGAHPWRPRTYPVWWH